MARNTRESGGQTGKPGTPRERKLGREELIF
jgi:hypothetical protein